MGKLINKEKSQKKVNSRYDEYLELFRNDKRETDYEKVKGLYGEIKEQYQTKIKNNEIRISIEKIRLERSLGKYNGNIFKFSINYFNTMLIVIITLFLEKMNLFSNEFKIFGDTYINTLLNNFLKVGTLVLLVLFLVKILNDKSTLLQNKWDVLDNIKLKVLEDLEKEYSAENAKKKEIENQQAIIEQLKSQNNNSKKDVLMDMVAPAMLEVTATLLKKDSWIKRIFRKSK